MIRRADRYPQAGNARRFVPKAAFGRNQIADCGFWIEETLTLIIRNRKSTIRNFLVHREAASENMRARRKELAE